MLVHVKSNVESARLTLKWRISGFRNLERCENFPHVCFSTLSSVIFYSCSSFWLLLLTWWPWLAFPSVCDLNEESGSRVLISLALTDPAQIEGPSLGLMLCVCVFAHVCERISVSVCMCLKYVWYRRIWLIQRTALIATWASCCSVENLKSQSKSPERLSVGLEA